MLMHQVRWIIAALGWTTAALAVGLIVGGCATSGNSEKLSDHEEAVQQRAARISDRL